MVFYATRIVRFALCNISPFEPLESQAPGFAVFRVSTCWCYPLSSSLSQCSLYSSYFCNCPVTGLFLGPYALFVAALHFNPPVGSPCLPLPCSESDSMTSRCRRAYKPPSCRCSQPFFIIRRACRTRLLMAGSQQSRPHDPSARVGDFHPNPTKGENAFTH